MKSNDNEIKRPPMTMEKKWNGSEIRMKQNDNETK